MPRPRAPFPYRTCNVMLYEPQLEQLERLAHRQRRSRAAVVREALDRYLQETALLVNDPAKGAGP